MKKFTNYTGQEFTCSWDGKEYNFLPGESAILEDVVAQVFAKHLANQKFEGTLVVSDQTFIDEMDKALSDASEQPQAEEIVEKIMEEVKIEEPKEEELVIEEEKPKKKGRKSKKETFEGLDELDETNI
jgi:hypothetical protein